MNKKIKITLATLGALDAVMYLLTPVIIFWIFNRVFELEGLGLILMFTLASASTLFRAIKIGWMK